MSMLRVAEGTEIFDLDPVRDREAWLAKRLEGATASQASVLLGQHRYIKSIGELVQTKLAPKPDKPNGAQLAGRYHEYATVARLALHERPGWRVEDPRVFVRDRATKLGATIDRLAFLSQHDWAKLSGCTQLNKPERRVVVEIKTVKYDRWDTDGWSRQPPVDAYFQALVGAMLLDADGAVVVCEQRHGYAAGEFAVHFVPRHAARERTILRRAGQFKQRLEQEQRRLKRAG